MMKYLEDCDDAFTNIDYVLKDEPEYAYSKDGTCYTNATKRSTFVTYFSVQHLTADLVDTVAENNTTWDEMVSSLRKRIARRMDNERVTNRRKAHTIQADLQAYDASALQSMAAVPSASTSSTSINNPAISSALNTL